MRFFASNGGHATLAKAHSTRHLPLPPTSWWAGCGKDRSGSGTSVCMGMAFFWGTSYWMDGWMATRFGGIFYISYLFYNLSTYEYLSRRGLFICITNAMQCALWVNSSD